MHNRTYGHYFSWQCSGAHHINTTQGTIGRMDPIFWPCKGSLHINTSQDIGAGDGVVHACMSTVALTAVFIGGLTPVEGFRV
jgi:hypothetical protein